MLRSFEALFCCCCSDCSIATIRFPRRPHILSRIEWETIQPNETELSVDNGQHFALYWEQNKRILVLLCDWLILAPTYNAISFSLFCSHILWRVFSPWSHVLLCSHIHSPTHGCNKKIATFKFHVIWEPFELNFIAIITYCEENTLCSYCVYLGIYAKTHIMDIVQKFNGNMVPSDLAISS